MTNPKKERENLTTEEIDAMLKKAEELPNEYFKLRAQCLIAIAKKFGKRRVEISQLERRTLKVVNGDLEIRFTLAKKRKKGLHQYIQFLERNNPEELSKTLPEIRLMWKEWQQTET